MGELVLKNSSLFVSKASKAWKFLHGTINVYKPAEMRIPTLMKAIKFNICKDLNEMELDEPKPLVQINSNENKGYDIQLVPNLGQHILATGPRYTPEQIKLYPAITPGYYTSGVMIIGVNKGVKFAHLLKNGAPIQTFQVTGKFGKSTRSNFPGDLVTMRSTYKHVTSGKIEAIVSSMQANYQRQMFDTCGVDIQSQEAYELACKGLIRPENTKHTVIYGIRNIEFTGKTFTIEVQSMNINQSILADLILKIAVQLRTVATCTKIRCTRYGYFSYEDSLLRSQWNLQEVLNNMHKCQEIWTKYPSMVRDDIATPVGYEEELRKS